MRRRGFLTAYALEGELAAGDDSPFGTDRSLAEPTYSLEPIDTGPEEPDRLEAAREGAVAEHGGRFSVDRAGFVNGWSTVG